MELTIRSKIIIVVISIAVFIAMSLTTISVASIHILNKQDSNQLLMHFGHETATSIDTIFVSAQHSVKNIYYYAYDQLESVFDRLYNVSFRKDYLERVSRFALSEAKNHDSVRVFYYRLSDVIQDEPKGFLFQKNALGEYNSMQLPDIIQFKQEENDQAGSYYYLPKAAKEGIWFCSYNANLTGKMISYVEPIYVYGRFTGIIGMDIDVNSLCKKLEKVTIYKTGSATLFDMEGNILYEKAHKNGLKKVFYGKNETTFLSAAQISLTTDAPVEFSSDKGKMKLFATKLSNGLIICISVPLKEINASRIFFLKIFILCTILLSLLAFFIAYRLIYHFLHPLQELSDASKKLTEGNLNFAFSYDKNDELGQLYKTFGIVSTSLQRYYDRFHNLAFTDEVTGLNNYSAFETTKNVISSELNLNRAEFTIIVMSISNLQTIKNNAAEEIVTLLKHVTACMRKVFVGFPLYRINDNEFCTIINDMNAQKLIQKLQTETAKISREDYDLFHCSYQIAAGAATYDKESDTSFESVFQRAHNAMQENEKEIKRTDLGTLN
ncbi:MAG: diguanylate cyclase [Treponema sp.]|nr:diguanylate cyclase [Treponema sp.]